MKLFQKTMVVHKGSLYSHRGQDVIDSLKKSAYHVFKTEAAEIGYEIVSELECKHIKLKGKPDHLVYFHVHVFIDKLK